MTFYDYCIIVFHIMEILLLSVILASNIRKPLPLTVETNTISPIKENNDSLGGNVDKHDQILEEVFNDLRLNLE